MLRSKVYLQIKERLQEKLPELQFIDLQKGQFVKPQQNYPIPLPACLIEFKPVTWSNAESGTQLGKTLISVYLYLDLVTDSFDNAEQEQETIELLDQQDSIFETLQGLDSEDFAPLNCINEEPAKYDVQRGMYFRTDFATEFYRSLIKETNKVPKPKPNFKFKNGNT